VRNLLLALLVLAAAAGGVALYRETTEKRRALHQLLAWERKNLLDEKEAQALFQRIVGKREAADTLGLQPWRVVRLGSRVYVLELQTFRIHPGADLLRAHEFGENGRPLSSVDFRTGWRCRVLNAQAEVKPAVPGPILVIQSGLSMGGTDVATQYYARTEPGLALIRLEDGEGRSIQNRYDHDNHRIGPEPPPRSPEAVEEALASADVVEILRTLLWLGGQHATDPAREYSPSNVAEEKKVRAALARAGVRARIEELKKSPNAWIREAAAAVK
jgi:hypothetical protein